MSKHSVHSLSASRRYLCALALAVAPLWVSAQTPSLAGPSVVQTSSSVEFVGRGYAPNSSVSIAVKTPDGGEAHFSAVVAADGTLSYRAVPQTPGVHTLTVLDSAGRKLAAVDFRAIR